MNEGEEIGIEGSIKILENNYNKDLKQQLSDTTKEVIKNSDGEIVELHCTYDPETKGGTSPDGRKVKGTIHCVNVEHAINAEARLYDRLFNTVNPEESGNFIDNINLDSCKILNNNSNTPCL